ncbi:MAG: hypothetical protein WCK53_03215 [Methanomicrobiales archaeon]
MNLIVQLNQYHINTGFHNRAIFSKEFFNAREVKWQGVQDV